MKVLEEMEWSKFSKQLVVRVIADEELLKFSFKLK